jgi:hypothetical protein
MSHNDDGQAQQQTKRVRSDNTIAFSALGMTLKGHTSHDSQTHSASIDNVKVLPKSRIIDEQQRIDSVIVATETSVSKRQADKPGVTISNSKSLLVIKKERVSNLTKASNSETKKPSGKSKLKKRGATASMSEKLGQDQRDKARNSHWKAGADGITFKKKPNLSATNHVAVNNHVAVDTTLTATVSTLVSTASSTNGDAQSINTSPKKKSKKKSKKTKRAKPYR